MKTNNKINNKYILLLLTGLFLNNAIAQTPLGTEFTYQGELKDSSGNPHDGAFDFSFTAYDTVTGGANIGSDTADDVQVSEGIFTTQLDFGSSAFIGDKVWLEISVRIGTSTGGYQQLLPRQQVTATPYATHAQFVAADAISTLEIENSSITAADLAANSVGTSEIISTQVQRRVTGNCGAGDFITAVNEDGSVTCTTENTGLTSVTSAEIVDGTIVAVDIATGAITNSEILDGTIINLDLSNDSINSNNIIDSSVKAVDVDSTQIQRRVIGSCNYPEYVTSIDENGDVVCDRMSVGVAKVLDATDTVGKHSSIAIGADNNPIISYYDTTNKDLKIVKCTEKSCIRSNTPLTLDSADEVGEYTSIAIGADNNPIISYYDSTNGSLKIVKCTNQSCSNFNTPISLALGGAGGFSSIAIGTDNNPIISYFDHVNGALKVVKCTNQSCSDIFNNTHTTLDAAGSTGRYTSIAIGADNNPIISFHNGAINIVKCTSQSCSTFNAVIEIEPFVGSVGYTSIAIGTDDLPMISYIDENGSAVKVVRCIDEICSSSAALQLDSFTVGLFDNSSTSIAIGADGNPIISYFEAESSNLKIAKCGFQACVFEPVSLTTLDLAGVVGGYSSIAIGVDNNPIISYYDATNGDLKVYSCADEYCSK